METAELKKFAQFARRSLIEQISVKLKVVTAENSAARRESAEAIKKLDEAIKKMGKGQIIERVAYIWFNRFCAFRFMDVNRYTRIGVVSPAEGQVQPEILAEAKMGHVDEEMVSDKTRQLIFALLDGKTPSRDPQGEAYRLLVVGACNHWHRAMPFLFERIDDYTELLIPEDLLSGNSILSHTCEAMTPDACRNVEVIGWLYQFYISEKKDEVFDGLKKNKKITPENIPAATQLFTPHWIVCYLVENSLGRLWMLNRPGSKLIEKMDYYIKPEQPETDFLRIGKPEEIKICDPACGSGHMLTYSFDLLYAIYEEEGYEPSEIPEKILVHNLYGIEIDERAGELAAFALTMKARAKKRLFFRKPVLPNICVLENVWFEEDELKNYMDFVGRDLFTSPLQTTLRQFEEADNFGSLIRPDVTDVTYMLKTLEEKNVSGQLFLSLTHQKVLKVLQQADYLGPIYHVVVANPPYMSEKGMTDSTKSFVLKNYKDSKSDIFACFIERSLELLVEYGLSAMVTMQVWLFVTAYENLRKKILKTTSLSTLVQIGFNSFPELNSKFALATATVIKNKPQSIPFAGCINLNNAPHSANKKLVFLKKLKSADIHYIDFQSLISLPGAPFAYWLSNESLSTFSEFDNISKFADAKSGQNTGDNNRFIRVWHEVSYCKIGIEYKSLDETIDGKHKWFPYNKGGKFRKWYGNREHVINWHNDGDEIKKYAVFRNKGKHWSRYIQNLKYMMKEGVTWTFIGYNFSARHATRGYLFDYAGCSLFPKNKNRIPFFLGLINSKVATHFLSAFNQSLNYQPGNISNIPCLNPDIHPQIKYIEKAVVGAANLSKNDDDSFETSRDFICLPLLQPEYRLPNIKDGYRKLLTSWREMTLDMKRLEEENNRILIEAYGLQEELAPEVLLSEISLTCNPNYRYGGDKSEEELEALLRADTIRELISYAVGCMFGRYALEKPGLILANQGETIEHYLKLVSKPSFPADEDNVIPMLDGDWFTDDIAERFRKFLRVAFGEEHYEANIEFIERALGKNGKARDIRYYFLKDFYSDHVKRYKKRPIYWLFSSPKGSFNALIYMHRYRPDTVSVVLNDYLREFRTKLTSHKNHLEAVSISAAATQAERTKAIKEIERLKKIIDELNIWEHDVLYPLATQRIEIDLDDGVKVNYPKFGEALKKIPGLS